MGIPITTGPDFQGFRITEYKGLVRGVVVNPTAPSKGFSEGISIIMGGKISEYAAMAEQTRRQAYDLMVQEAWALGANGIIGVRYDSYLISEFRVEILCYGTAVTIEMIEPNP